ncbi:hypothetical protein D3Z53_17695 [Lachnospiraceae bacterium]|nr:NAD(P)H-dependent oxidoreductase [Ruminococcus sp.]NBI59840.1 hypothetical protein [Lachnospiraceae bacterium]
MSHSIFVYHQYHAVQNDSRACPHNQKIQPVMEQIEESDAVIFSVPCFQGHLPGIMKNFTDGKKDI